MYRKCATEISVQHQHQLTQALLKLMDRIPYSDITVKQICETAGISRRIFYHLFPGKQDALFALVDLIILDSEGYQADSRNNLLGFFTYWRQQGRLFDALEKNSLTNVLWERMLQIVQAEAFDVRYWLKSTDSGDDEDTLLFTMSGIMGMTFTWYQHGFDRSPEEMAQMMARLVRKPLLPDELL